MTYYRVTSGDQDVFAAVAEYGAQDESLQARKPDDSWLPKTKKKYLKDTMFWTEDGMMKYAESGLKDWHELVLADPLEVHMTEELPGRVTHQNKYQIFTQ